MKLYRILHWETEDASTSPVCMYTQLFSCVQHFVTPQTVDRQAPLSRGVS